MEVTSSDFASEWSNHTIVHPLGAAAVVALGVLVLTVPRKHVAWPFFLMACFVPSAQRIIVAGADFDFLRILVLFGTCRVLVNSEYAKIRFTRLDWALVAWALIAFTMPLIRGGPAVLVNRLGFLYDVVGMYFLFRCFVRSWEDAAEIGRCLAMLAVPVAMFFFIEWATSRNVFAVFGGVPAITEVRDGRLRCQGAFSHPILAGCFWASALPLIAVQWWQGRRALAVVSSGAALFIVFACASATPVVGVLVAVMGAGLYFVRQHLMLLRWGLVATLVCLHFMMKAPVWHLIARTSSLGGSSWHRYALLDGAINHVHEWWLVGSRVGTGHWGHFTFDVTNYYIVQAIHGGLLQLGLFLIVIAIAFAQVGKALRIRHLARREVFLTWAIGVSLVVHATSLFGVSYFGQIWIGWYILLGVVGGLPAITGESIGAIRRQTEYSVSELHAEQVNVTNSKGI